MQIERSFVFEKLMQRIEKEFKDDTFHTQIANLLQEKEYKVSMSHFNSSLKQTGLLRSKRTKKWKSVFEFSKNTHDFRLILRSPNANGASATATIEIKVSGRWRSAKSKSHVLHHGELEEIEGILKQL